MYAYQFINYHLLYYLHQPIFFRKFQRKILSTSRSSPTWWIPNGTFGIIGCDCKSCTASHMWVLPPICHPLCSSHTLLLFHTSYCSVAGWMSLFMNTSHVHWYTTRNTPTQLIPHTTQHTTYNTSLLPFYPDSLPWSFPQWCDVSRRDELVESVWHPSDQFWGSTHTNSRYTLPSWKAPFLYFSVSYEMHIY